MKPNFKKLAKHYEQNAVVALQELVHKNSVYDASTISEEAPYGKGVKSALDYVAKLGKEYGFAVDACDGRCTELSFGEGEGPLIGIYAHSDVVPVSGKWSSGPFDAKVVGEGKQAKMIGRGTSDDKGPLIASLYALKLLKDNGLIKGYRVRLVAGGDEERGSSCLAYYFHKLNKPASDYGFTPDAEFPLIYAEKGITHATASLKVDLGPIVAMDGGVVANAVCDKMVVTLPSDKKLLSYLKEKAVACEAQDLGAITMLIFKGKSAHGSTPELGENAGLLAFKVLGEFYNVEFLKKLYAATSECHGKNFGGYSYSPDFGQAAESTFNFGIIKYVNGVLSMTIDFRYGEKGSPEDLKKFEEATGMKVDVKSTLPLLYFDTKSPLVSTLMKSYKHMTHKFFDKPLAIGGGTYAKEAPNCVAYGSAFKGREGNIHSPDEYIYLDDLFAQIAIYADAVYSLGQLKK